MNTLLHIAKKYGLTEFPASPIELVDVHRDELGVLFAELGFTVGAEIGVNRGKYSRVLLDANPKLEMYCVDAWKAYKGYVNAYHGKQNSFDIAIRMAKELLAGFNVHFINEPSQSALKYILDDSLDFVYIDANHDLPWVYDDIVGWEKKVRPGGIVAGHDYLPEPPPPGHMEKIHVKEGLELYMKDHDVSPWFILGRPSMSWFWVKK